MTPVQGGSGAMSNAVDVEPGAERVPSITSSGDLEQIREAGVQAVLLPPAALPDWMDELAHLAGEGAFDIPRTILHGATPAEIEASVDSRLAACGLPPGLAVALRADRPPPGI